jgi:ketosteroid isomerase-like protein
MKKSVFALPLLLCAGLASAAASADLQASFSALLDTEAEFSRFSVEKGVVAAFDRFAPGAVLLRPTPEGAKGWHERMKTLPIDVDWGSQAAEISRSGDFAWVVGPWTATLRSDRTQHKYGHYLTVWRKGSDGSWKVLSDAAVATQEAVAPTPVPRTVRTPGESPAGAVALDAILDVDSKASAAARSDVDAYMTFLSDDARLMRMFTQPVVGKAAIRAALAQPWVPIRWRQGGGDVSPGGDMAYTYGIVEDPASHGWTEGAYLRIWEKQPDGSWAMAVDLACWAVQHAPAPSDTPKTPG